MVKTIAWKCGRWAVLILSFVLAMQLAPASAQAQNRAGIVIQYGDGRIATYCIRFGEPSITGLDLLNRTGLKVIAEVGGLGSAMCSIGGQGCAYPSQPCFCKCQGASCAYWNYLHLIDGAWRYSPIGAAGYTITDGAVDAWAWGDKVTPPVYTIDQMCAASAGQPTSHPPNTPATDSASQRTSESTARPTIVPAGEPTIAPTARRVGEPTVPPTNRPTLQPSDEPASQPTNEPTLQPANGPATQVDAGGYAAFAVIILGLGGWLIVTRSRKGK